MLFPGKKYLDIDCVADSETERFKVLALELEKHVSFYEQATYGKYVLWFGSVLVFILLLKNAWFRYRDYSYRQYASANFLDRMINKLSAGLRFVGYRRISIWLSHWCSIPSSLGTVIVMTTATVFMLCYCLIPHPWYRPCLRFGAPPLATRAGTMSVSLFPFVYLLGGKSNFISFFTGISYEKLNVWHQYVGLASFALAVIHTVPWVYQPFTEAGLKTISPFYVKFYITGIVLLAMQAWLVFASKVQFRKLCYEFFVKLHIIIGVLFVLGMFAHFYIDPRILSYLITSVGFIVIQTTYRMSFKTCLKPGKHFLKPRSANIKVLPCGKAMMVTISNTEGYYWKAGQHCFLRFGDMKTSKKVQNHPFSIATVKSNTHQNDMSFIIVPGKGLTRDLFEEVKINSELTKKCYLDGPYGGTIRDPLAFDKAFVMATGSGVTATLPFVSQFVNCLGSGIPMATKAVHFVWVIREENTVGWIQDELARCKAIAGDKLTIDIYVTARTHAHQKQASTSFQNPYSGKEHFDSELTTKKSNDSVDFVFQSNSLADSIELPEKVHTRTFHDEATYYSVEPYHKLAVSTFANVHYTRPSTTALVEQCKLGPKNFFVTCGNNNFKKEAANTIAALQKQVLAHKNGSYVQEIYLHTESFGW